MSEDEGDQRRYAPIDIERLRAENARLQERVEELEDEQGRRTEDHSKRLGAMYRQRDALQTRVEEAQEHVARLGVAVEMFEEELKDVEALAERRKGLTFAAFQHLNRQRCDEAFTHGVEDWPIQNWALAIAGEAGELCNLIKKIIRGDFTVEEKRDEIIEELADVITYCDLAMSRMGVATDDSLLRKFDKVSERRGWSSPARAAIEEGT